MDQDTDRRLARISDAMHAAHGAMRDLVDLAGCHAETERDAWIFRDGVHDHDVHHADIDVVGGSLIMGRLRVELDAEASTGPMPASFSIDGTTWTFDALDLEGNALHDIEELAAACAAWSLEGRRIIVEHDGGSTLVDGKTPIRGVSPTSGHTAILVPALGIDLAWFLIGTNGIFFENPQRAVVMPHGGGSVAFRTE